MPTTDFAVTVTADANTEPRVVLDLPVAVADHIMTLIARSVPSRPEDARLLNDLYRAVSHAIDATAPATAIGCPGLWPDAAPMQLTEPAVLGSNSGDILAVLIPGHPTNFSAVEIAASVAREAGVDVAPDDTTWTAEVWPPQWMILNTCEADHDFHPELAAHGPRTPGAVLITRVDLARTTNP